jgi:hypothetical protein
MDTEGYSRSVAEDAGAYALSALQRRRPDLKPKRGKPVDVPDEERAQFELDRLAFVCAVAERLRDDMTPLVFASRRSGASWARVGLAINESPQTAFNRYRKLDGPSTSAISTRPARKAPRT